jgi:hypothetical protein
MNYTEKEIKNIQGHAFDKGWRFGILFMGVLCIIAFILIVFNIK